MGKILVIKHVAQENLGLLKEVIADRRIAIRYVNYGRNPEAEIEVERYLAVIILGGWMGVYEAEKYHHIRAEFALVETALKKRIPILGICLGSQILAHVLGAKVEKHHTKEIGWCEVNTTKDAKDDPLFPHFHEREKVFQMHGDTFEIPRAATHLLESKNCPSQVFRFDNFAYGIQFHLEMNRLMINQLLICEKTRLLLQDFCETKDIGTLALENADFLRRSNLIGTLTFENFLDLFSEKAQKNRGHGKQNR